MNQENPNSNSNPKTGLNLSKRASGLIGISALPATIVSFCGDLFTPMGGWIIVGLIGIISIIVSCYLVASLSLINKGARLPWWYRLTSNDEELGWVWQSSNPFGAHGVHVTAFFGLVCLFFSQQSFAARDSGGLLAENVSAIAVAQKQLGISERILEQQIKTTIAVESLDKKADNFKKEISENPRIQLADKGVLWESARLTAAIQSGDATTVALFLEGGMPISIKDSEEAFRSSSGDVKKLLSNWPQSFVEKNCPRLFARLNYGEIKDADSVSIELVKSLCTNRIARESIQSELDKENAQAQEAMRRYKAESAALKSPEECMRHELRNGERALLTEASRFSLTGQGTLDLRKQMLSQIYIDISTFMESDVRNHVRKYCERQAAEKPTPPDISSVEKWKILDGWIND